MPIITSVHDFYGVAQRIERHALAARYEDCRSVLSFPLHVLPSRYANGTQGLRRTIDANFGAIPGWTCIKSGGADWTAETATRSRIAVEVQVSGRSDMLGVDVLS